MSLILTLQSYALFFIPPNFLETFFKKNNYKIIMCWYIDDYGAVKIAVIYVRYGRHRLYLEV